MVKSQLLAERSTEALAVLVTIEDDTLPAPLRYTDQPVTRLSDDPIVYGLVSQGETYVWALGPVVLPDEASDGGNTTITIDNVVEDVAPSLRLVSADAVISIAAVLTGVPDERFVVTTGLRLVDRRYDMQSVTLEVSRHANRSGAPDLLYPLSAYRMTRRTAPGIFR